MSLVNLNEFESTIDNKINAEKREIMYLNSYKIIIDEYTSDILNLNISKYTVFRLRFNNPSNFNLFITPNNFMNPLYQQLSDNTIKTNDDIFNSKFIFSTNNKKLTLKLFKNDNVRNLLLSYLDRHDHNLNDIHISDWKNSTFLSAKECQGELKLMVSGVITSENVKDDYLNFLKELINDLNAIGVLYH